MSSFGPINTATFGGLSSSESKKNYWKCLKDELNKFDSITQGNSFKLGQTAFNKLVQRISA